MPVLTEPSDAFYFDPHCAYKEFVVHRGKLSKDIQIVAGSAGIVMQGWS